MKSLLGEVEYQFHILMMMPFTFHINPISLFILDLSFNNIDVIEGLEKLTKLEDLTLYNNRIATIENMDVLTHLHVLSLGNNDLDKLENVSVQIIYIYIEILLSCIQIHIYSPSARDTLEEPVIQHPHLHSGSYIILTANYHLSIVALIPEKIQEPENSELSRKPFL